MNFVYSIIVNYRFPLDRLDVYILYLKLAEGPGANARLPPLAAPLINKSNLYTIFIKILTIVIINFKLLLHMKNKCAIVRTKSLLHAIALIVKEMGYSYAMSIFLMGNVHYT